MKKIRTLGARAIFVLGLAGMVLALAGTGYAGGTIEAKPSTTERNIAIARLNFTLSVDVGRGVLGAPASGRTTLKQGTVVKYGYSSRSSQPVVVKLDGVVVPASGAVVMNAHHKLEAFINTSAVKKYTLKVMETYQQMDIPCHAGTTPCKHLGVPACGEYQYNEGTVVAFNLWQYFGHTASAYLAAYPPPPGCPPVLKDIAGEMEPGVHVTGSFVMDRDYTLVIWIDIE